ncbi:MAG: mechanosensitive ion channel domain-containing protein [Armatimonadota bacterium]
MDWLANYYKIILEDHTRDFLTAIIKIIVIIIAYFIIRKIIFKLLNKIISKTITNIGTGIIKARESRIQALQSIIRSIASFIIGFIAVTMILQTVGIPILTIIGAASIGGLAVGFGAQRLVRDVISGFFILIEDQYGVGEYVTIGAVTGTVVELGIRTTKIIDEAGKLFILSNGDIVSVANHSRGPIKISLDFTLKADTDIEKAKELLEKAGRKVYESYETDVDGFFKTEGIVAATGASKTLRLSGKVSAHKQEIIKTSLYEEVIKSLIDEEIQLA